MIYYDPARQRLRDSDTGRFVAGAEEYLETFFGEEWEEKLEDLFLFYEVEKKTKEKKVSKEKEISARGNKVKERLNEVIEDFEDIMDEEVIY